MLRNKKILIIAVTFILFLSTGIVSASDLADSSIDSNIIAAEDNCLIDNSIGLNSMVDDSAKDDSLLQNSISKEKTADLSVDIKNNGNSNDSIKAESKDNKNKTIAKSKTKITANKVNAYYKDKSQLKVYLKESHKKALKNKSLRISINNRIYFRKTNALGMIALKLNLKPNKYNVRIRFDGDKEYYASSLKTVVNVKKDPLLIKTRNSKSYYHPDTFFKAKVINKLTKMPVEGVKVLFNVYSSRKNFKNYYSLTDKNGIATLNKRLKAGKYDVYSFIKAKKQLFSYKKKINKALLTAMDTREIGCSSIYVHINENESAVAFRRDSTYAANLHIIAQRWHGRHALKQYKTTGTYFFHSIVTSDGWMMGTGGWDNPSVNKKIENLAGKIVSSNSIKTSFLKSILAQERRLKTGHFTIVAPDGRYAVLWRSGYIRGTLKNGEYLLVPNARSLFRHGKSMKFSSNTATAALKIAACDVFGVNRRNIMAYHYKRTTKNFKTTASVRVYGSNDKGNLMGRHTAGKRDNVYYKKNFISKFKLFGTPRLLYLGTHNFGNIDKYFKTQTKLSAPNVTRTYGQSGYLKLALRNRNTNNLLKGVKISLRVYTGSTYKNYVVRTNQYGIAYFNTYALDIGNHKVLISPANNRYMISGQTRITIEEPNEI